MYPLELATEPAVDIPKPLIDPLTVVVKVTVLFAVIDPPLLPVAILSPYQILRQSIAETQSWIISIFSFLS